MALAAPYLLFATFVPSISEDMLTRSFVKRALPRIGAHWGWNFANQAADSALDVQRLSENASPLLSATAHLLMLAVVIYFRPRSTSHQMAPAISA